MRKHVDSSSGTARRRRHGRVTPRVAEVGRPTRSIDVSDGLINHVARRRKAWPPRGVFVAWRVMYVKNSIASPFSPPPPCLVDTFRARACNRRLNIQYWRRRNEPNVVSKGRYAWPPLPQKPGAAGPEGETRPTTRATDGTGMSDQDAFKRTLAAMYDAMLDDTRWPAASALIDEACGVEGNDLLVGEGPTNDVRVHFVGVYSRGQRREDLERDYLEHYHPIDERVPRVRQLPDGHLVHMRDLFTAKELKTSPTYNEALVRSSGQDGLTVRLQVADGSHAAWCVGNPVDSDGWGSSRLAMFTALLPHVRQFVRVRQALVRADAQTTTVTALLDNPRIGVLHLDRRGRIMAANDRARDILGHGDGLSDPDGVLRARAPADQGRLERLVGNALPVGGEAAVGGSMLLRRSPALPPFVVHVKPVPIPRPDYGAPHVAALVLIVEPGAPASRRPPRGGHDPGPDADAESGGGLVGGGPERARHGPGDGALGGHHLLAPEADLPEAVHLAAGRPGAAGAVARRARLRPPAAGGGRAGLRGSEARRSGLAIAGSVPGYIQHWMYQNDGRVAIAP